VWKCVTFQHGVVPVSDNIQNLSHLEQYCLNHYRTGVLVPILAYFLGGWGQNGLLTTWHFLMIWCMRSKRGDSLKTYLPKDMVNGCIFDPLNFLTLQVGNSTQGSFTSIKVLEALISITWIIHIICFTICSFQGYPATNPKIDNTTYLSS